MTANLEMVPITKHIHIIEMFQLRKTSKTSFPLPNNES